MVSSVGFDCCNVIAPNATSMLESNPRAYCNKVLVTWCMKSLSCGLMVGVSSNFFTYYIAAPYMRTLCSCGWLNLFALCLNFCGVLHYRLASTHTFCCCCSPSWWWYWGICLFVCVCWRHKIRVTLITSDWRVLLQSTWCQSCLLLV